MELITSKVFNSNTSLSLKLELEADVIDNSESKIYIFLEQTNISTMIYVASYDTSYWFPLRACSASLKSLSRPTFAWNTLTENVLDRAPHFLKGVGM